MALDVDGVLWRGAQLVPGAVAALTTLREAQVPFVVFTNGGGVSEQDKAEALSKKLGMLINPEQVVQSHTPFRSVAQKHRDETVLVIGKRYERLRGVLHTYGLKHVVTPEELHLQNPLLYPDAVPQDWLEMDANRGSGTIEGRPIGAVMIMTDPIVWGRELQLCLDVLRSHDNSKLGESTRVDGAQIPLYNSAADLEYVTELEAPRLGAGAFRIALENLHLQTTGVPLKQTQYGKPQVGSYRFVEQTLHDLGTGVVDRFYMVGDNPQTDIRGAKLAGPAWTSILTRTGVFRGLENDSCDPADVVVADVDAAIKWILTKERCF